MNRVFLLFVSLSLLSIVQSQTSTTEFRWRYITQEQTIKNTDIKWPMISLTDIDIKWPLLTGEKQVIQQPQLADRQAIQIKPKYKGPVLLGINEKIAVLQADARSKVIEAIAPATIQAEFQKKIQAIEAIEAVAPLPSMECTEKSLTHWVFALDESSSMQGSKWEKLKTLMDDVADITQDKMSVYTFDQEATIPAIQYYLYGDPAGWDSSVLPSTPGGGTNFGNPLLRAIETIMQYKTSHTCFAMITDGQAPYPTTQVNLFNLMMQEMNRMNCRTCAVCYFIQGKANEAVPEAFEKLCKSIGAQTPVPRSSVFRGSGNFKIARGPKTAPVVAVSDKNFQFQVLSSLKQVKSIAQSPAA